MLSSCAASAIFCKTPAIPSRVCKRSCASKASSRSSSPVRRPPNAVLPQREQRRARSVPSPCCSAPCRCAPCKKSPVSSTPARRSCEPAWCAGRTSHGKSAPPRAAELPPRPCAPDVCVRVGLPVNRVGPKSPPMTVGRERMTRNETTASPVELWLVDLARASAALACLERQAPRLGRRDRARIEALKDAEVRQQRLAAHVALRILCERRLGRAVRGLNLKRAAGAKPRLNPSVGPLDFSLAHVEGAALIGITRGRAIGVDLEDVRPVRIAGDRRRRILEAGTALNAAVAKARSEEEAFVRAWVCLEALAKAEGVGLARTLAALGLRQVTAGDGTDVALAVQRHLSLT